MAKYKENSLILSGKHCPYCDCSTELVSGDAIYPQYARQAVRPDFLDKKYYRCIKNHDHYVGTCNDNVTSLGRVADAELRYWKHQGHEVFNPLSRGANRKFRNTNDAYRWLSEKMNLPSSQTHFGMFDVEQCKRAIEFCKELNKNKI
jgi:hypothetical protein